MERPICAFPNCTKIRASKGKRNNPLGLARYKWCVYHRKGKGKQARLEYSKTI